MIDTVPMRYGWYYYAKTAYTVYCTSASHGMYLVCKKGGDGEGQRYRQM